eukprot:PhF_6_TR41639/c0_g1_i2/m.63109
MSVTRSDDVVVATLNRPESFDAEGTIPDDPELLDQLRAELEQVRRITDEMHEEAQIQELQGQRNHGTTHHRGGGGAGGGPVPFMERFVTANSIFCANIPTSATKDEVIQWVQSGAPNVKVVKAQILVYPNGASKGLANVELGTPEEAVTAISVLHNTKWTASQQVVSVVARKG